MRTRTSPSLGVGISASTKTRLSRPSWAVCHCFIFSVLEWWGDVGGENWMWIARVGVDEELKSKILKMLKMPRMGLSSYDIMMFAQGSYG